MSERTNGPTPNGGAYSIAYFKNDKGEATTKDKATQVEIIEFSRAGEEIIRTYLTIANSERREPYTAGPQATGPADYLRLAALAFDYATARTEAAAEVANTAALNDCATPDIYERWAKLCDQIAHGKITEPGRAVEYLQGDK